MNEQKKQNILTAIIIILVLALVLLIGSIVYEEVININKQQIQNTNAPSYNEEEKEESEEYNPNEDNVVSEENDNTTDEVEIETEEDKESKEDIPVEDNKKEEYVGEEENTTTEKNEISVEDKVINLVKKEWGQDSSVTFNIEKKNGTKYRVAVRDNSTTVLAWYEVDTQNWNVSEY